jgi:hypothetical protein
MRRMTYDSTLSRMDISSIEITGTYTRTLLTERFVSHDEYLSREPESATPAAAQPLDRYRVLVGRHGSAG